MPSHRPASIPSAPDRSRIHWASAACLGVLVALPALCVDDPAEVVEALCSAAALAYCGLWLLWCVIAGGVPRRATLFLTAAAALWSVSALQLVPLGWEVLDRVAPATAALKRQAADAGVLDAVSTCLSLNPNAGADELARWATGLLFLTAVVLGPADPRRLRAALWVLVGIGAALAYLSLLQHIIGRKALFWLDPETTEFGRIEFAATFHNRNRFAGFLGVCVGAGVGLLLEAVLGGRRKGSPEAGGDEPTAGRAWLIPLIPAVAGMAAAVVLTRSRGGTVALAAAMAAAGFALLLRPRTRGYAVFPAAVTLAAVLLVGWFGWDPARERLATLADAEKVQESRLRLWGESLRLLNHVPFWGVGHGGFVTAFPMTRTFVFDGTFTHPENDYLQTLVELGVPGAAAAAVVLALLAWAAVRCAGRALDGHGLAAGPPFAVAALLVSVIADFGFQGAANRYLFLLAIGLCVQQAWFRRATADRGMFRAGDPGAGELWPGGPAVAAVAAAAVAVAGWLILDRQFADARAAREAAVYQLIGPGRLKDFGEPELRAVERLRPDCPQRRAWVGAARALFAADEEGSHRPNPNGPIFRDARRSYEAAIAACPVFGKAYLGLGRLYQMVDDPRAGPLLATAERMDGTDPFVAREHGRWLLFHGSPQDALARYARCAELGRPSELQDILPSFYNNYPPGTLDWSAASSDPKVRRMMADFLRRRGRETEARTLEAGTLDARPPEPR
jgi:O-antigen ligase